MFIFTLSASPLPVTREFNDQVQRPYALTLKMIVTMVRLAELFEMGAFPSPSFKHLQAGESRNMKITTTCNQVFSDWT